MPPGSPPPYNPDDFPPVAVTVDVVVFTIRYDELHVLLVERGQEPFKGSWALPGGFVLEDEDLDAAAARELQEETNLSADGLYLEQLGSYGTPRRDPRMRVITVAYWAACAELAQPRGGGDAAYSDLVPVAKIERGGIRLAFDHHRIVRDAVKRLRAKLEYTALATTFCPPRFTISQLRRVYETIWGRPARSRKFPTQDSPESRLQACTDGAVPESSAWRPAGLALVHSSKIRSGCRHVPHGQAACFARRRIGGIMRRRFRPDLTETWTPWQSSSRLPERRR